MKNNQVISALRSLTNRLFGARETESVHEEWKSADTMLDMTYHMCRRRHQELLVKIEMQRASNDSDRAVIDNFLRPTSA